MTITLTREEAQQVLDAMELCQPVNGVYYDETDMQIYADAIETLRARLAQPEPKQCSMCGSVHSAYIRRCAGCGHMKGLENPEWSKTKPEPVAWASENVIPLRGLADNHACLLTPFKCAANTVPLYTAPPQREWQGLTDEEIDAAADEYEQTDFAFARAIEYRLKEKNT
jgi:hypothetical protein